MSAMSMAGPLSRTPTRCVPYATLHHCIHFPWVGKVLGLQSLLCATAKNHQYFADIVTHGIYIFLICTFQELTSNTQCLCEFCGPAMTCMYALLLQYYDDAAGILRSIILSAIAPHRLATAPPQLPLTSASMAKDEAMMLAERQATEEPNFLPYAAMDSIDEVDDRWASLLCVLAGHQGKANVITVVKIL